MKVLAVCLGNICRSPAAEAAIRKAVDDAGLDIEIDSAGTGSWHIGDPPHPESVAAGARVGLDVTGRARKFNSLDFERFDIILVMDKLNLDDVLGMARSTEDRAKVRLFRTYDPNTAEEEVPDPWGGPAEGYDETLRIVTAAASGFVDQLSAQLG